MTKHLVLSLGVHFVVFMLLIGSINHTAMLPVFENTNQQDVISAVMLGDTIKSHIMAPPQALIQPPAPTHNNKPAPTPKATVSEQAIAIKAVAKVVKNKPHELAKAKLQELINKNLLADIKQAKQHGKLKQKQLQKQFTKTLQEQAEQTLRQQLMEEDIKLQAEQIRQAQGQVNKYKALILQAISTNWIVPAHVDKKLMLSVLIHLAPGGTVLDVQIAKTSGDPALDSSVRAAVLKASPLPVPSNGSQFNVFRQFVLDVKPEIILPQNSLS